MFLALICCQVVEGSYVEVDNISSLHSAALRTNAIYYGTYLSIFCVLLVYVVSKVGFSLSQLKLICITASNTWGIVASKFHRFADTVLVSLLGKARF